MARYSSGFLISSLGPFGRSICLTRSAKLSGIGRPDSESEIEDSVFAAAAVIFVEPGKSERARDALRQALGGKRFEYLVALLAFIRAAHFWTVTHPGLEIEDDMRTLMSEEKELASLLLQDPDLPER